MDDGKKFEMSGYPTDGNLCIYGNNDYDLVGTFGTKKAMIVDEHDLIVKEIADAVMGAIKGGKNDR